MYFKNTNRTLFLNKHLINSLTSLNLNLYLSVVLTFGMQYASEVRPQRLLFPIALGTNKGWKILILIQSKILFWTRIINYANRISFTCSSSLGLL